ncbi:MAG TPA: aldehyde dehydrogenase family protein [Anaerovoracaceae bacterium]|nr:aldehyde dehydrogenase family protein [Anaerovoracaceae bacterium]
MAIQEKQLELIVKAVMEELDRYKPALGSSGSKKNGGVFESVDEAVEAAWAAQKAFRKYSLEARERIIKSIKEEMTGNIELISRMAVEETGMGRVDDKIKKNLLALNKTPGTEDLKAEAFTGDDGLTLLELSPFGVIGAITPATNPSETVICNAIGMIAAGNSVVFCSHPTARKTSMKTIEIINEAVRKAEGPENLVTAIADPTMENASALMKHPKINMITATGGPGLVKAALSSGKKVIGAGAGNPPVVVDDTADLEQAAKDIVNGASFDNNLPCIAEKEVIVVDNAADYLIFNMQKHGAYLLKDQGKIDELAALVITKDGYANRDYIGKDAGYILSKIGIYPEKPARLIIAETNSEHPFFVEELMMPILPIVRVKNVDDAIELAIKAEHGNRHTAIMHSKNVDHLTKCARDVQTTIFVKNAASYAGIGFGGEGYTTFTIAGPTGEGLTSAKTFTRKRRCVLAGGFLIK